MKKGLTLIEVLLSITILAMIMVAISALYGVAVKDYFYQASKSNAQTQINATADQIAKQIKESASAPDTIGGGAFTRDSNPDNVLILGLPAKDNSNNFLYNGGVLLEDYFVYYLSNAQLHRKIYSDASGTRSELDNTDVVLLKNVSHFECTNTSVTDYFKISCDISISKIINGKQMTVTAHTVSNLRNK